MIRCIRSHFQSRSKRCLSSIIYDTTPAHLIVSGKENTSTTVSIENVKRTPATCDIEDIFNKKKLTIMKQRSGLFGNIALTNPEDFGTQLSNVITKCDDLVAKVLKDKMSGQITIQLLDEIVEQISALTDLAAFIAEGHAEPKFKCAAQQTCKEAEMYVEQLNRNSALFQALRNVVNDKSLWQELDQETRQVAKLFLLDFENSGAHLSKQKQENLINLKNEINKSGIDYLKECYTPAVIPLKSCPDPLLGLPLHNDKIVLKDWYHNDTSDSMREHAWKHYYKHDKRREMLLHNILDQRHSLARDTGFKNYAERVLQGSMAENPETVGEFLEELKIQLGSLAREELIFLEIQKKEVSRYWHDEQTIFPWDVQYYCEDHRNTVAKSQMHVFNPSWSDFLSIGTVMEQIGVFFEELYGVKLVPEIPLTGELWSTNVIKIGVEHETEGLIGFIYCDFYEENGAPSPSHHLIQCNAKSRIPIVVVKCQYTASNGYRPAHLTLSTLDRLFSELGNTIHSLFSSTKFYQSSSCYLSPDVKKVSSCLMKEIGRHPAVLHLVLKHHTRKRVLPRVKPHRILPISNTYGIFNATELENQLLYSALDHRLHTTWDTAASRESSTEIFAQLTEEYTHVPYVEGSAAHLRFSSLFTQGGTYYSNLWCKAIANILFDEIFKKDPFSRHGGEYFREHFLKHGAACNPRELVENLTGTKLTPQRLATALCHPIELSKNYEQGYNPEGIQGIKPGIVETPKQLTTSPLLYRLANTHPHLLTEDNQLTDKVFADDEIITERQKITQAKRQQITQAKR